MKSTALQALVSDILHQGETLLDGVHRASPSFPNLVAAISDWGRLLQRDLNEIVAGVEPSIRQSILMSLIPAKAIDPDYDGSYDAAIEEHLKELDLMVDEPGKLVIRNLCINIKKLQGLDRRGARNAVASLAQIRANPPIYRKLIERQNGRCLWCGILLNRGDVSQTLEHIVPKHLGNDPSDGTNWGLSCTSCNYGKGAALAWSATPWAHDYLGRTQFSTPDGITLQHRWVTLRRSPKCEFCGTGPKDAELWVRKRVQTGLPIPANCSTVCTACARTRGAKVLKTVWAPAERGRAIGP
jgi:hypothetical protein